MALNVDITYGGMLPARRITWEWEADAAGAFEGIVTKELRGIIMRVAFVPGTSGDQPDDNYDITCEDEQGLDVFKAQGVNLDEAVASDMTPSEAITDGTYTGNFPLHVDGTLELKGAGAGDSNKGTVILYLASPD